MSTEVRLHKGVMFNIISLGGFQTVTRCLLILSVCLSVCLSRLG